MDGLDEVSFWMDGSKMHSGHAGASVAWYHSKWKTQRTYLGTNKELFDAELYSMREALLIVQQNVRKGREAGRYQSGPCWLKVHIWADLLAVIKTLQHADPCPRQRLAKYIIRRAQQLAERRTEVEVHWVPRHMGVEGNERADEAAMEPEEKAGIRRCPERFTVLTHVGRTISELKWKKAKHLFRGENDRCLPLQREWYYPALDCQGLNETAMQESAYVSRRYFQQRSGHAVMGTYL